VFTIAAIRSGMVRVEHRWDRSPRLLFADGEEFDIKAVLETLESGPNGATRVRAWLRQVGIDISLAAPQQTQADATGANVVGAMANVKVGKNSMDLLITDEGLVFTPCPKSTDQGKKRLTELIGSQPVAQLAAQPECLWIPFEEIASATMHRAMPLKAALALHNGSTYDIQETLSGEELGKSGDTLRQVMQNLGARGS
jgi:hypothetical protein